MSYLLFLDESGHDHKQMPYEVRGGFSIKIDKLWPFVRALKELENEAFGAELTVYKSELKGSKLLERKRFRFAKQEPLIERADRQKLARTFLSKGLEHKIPTSKEFAAYGQASLFMADGVFRLLEEHGAKVFASAIPRGATKEASEKPDF